nr:hypothetical protein [Tanacetum cinerariifolium]
MYLHHTFDTHLERAKYLTGTLEKMSSMMFEDYLQTSYSTSSPEYPLNIWPVLGVYRKYGARAWAESLVGLVLIHPPTLGRCSSDIKTEVGGRPVIWFDVEKEEFGLIDPSKRMCDIWRNYSFYYDQVVDLNGKVGYVCTVTMEFSLLNHKKEWVPHCRFKEEIVPYGYKDVIGCCKKDGDILRNCISGDPFYAFYVYNLKSGVIHKTSLAGSGACPGVFMYSYTLSSIHDINTNSFSMKTTDVMKSCRDLRSFHTLTESKEKNRNGSSKPAIVFKKDIQVILLTDDEVVLLSNRISFTI